MKEQYVGDENDFRKYALLRLLAARGLKVGICWMLTAADSRTDGGKIGYLRDASTWRAYEPEVFDKLSELVTQNVRSVLRVEALGLMPHASYFSDYLEDAANKRAEYFQRARALFEDRDLIFFDPDNGLDVKSVGKGSRNSAKYLYRDELRAHLDGGQSVLFYQHFPRQKREVYLAALLAEIRGLAAGCNCRAFWTPQVAFILVTPAGMAITADPLPPGWGREFLASL